MLLAIGRRFSAPQQVVVAIGFNQATSTTNKVRLDLQRRLLSSSQGRFKDSLILRASGGKGGDGCMSFEGRALGKESPDGGHGGRDGKNGSGQGKTGKRGEDLELPVPVGTVIYRAGPSRRERKEMLEMMDEDEDAPTDAEDHESRLLSDLSEPGQHFTIARGGFPGKGNIMQSTLRDHFLHTLSPTERMGKDGTNTVVELRLKSIADACLVGYPNAGKSSLLGALSHSRPKVASYPFTTLHPHIGMIEFSDAKRVTLADLPGLVDGASQNRGMGHQFLQHVERTKVLVFVLDGAPETYERENATTVAEDLSNLVKELDLYMEGLSSRPSLVVINKLDRPAAKEIVELEWEDLLNNAPENCHGRIFPVSARDGTGLEPFVTELRKVVEQVQKEEEEDRARGEAQRHVRRQKYRPLQRIGRAQEGRRALLHRIKRREATHGEGGVTLRKKKTTK